MNKYLSTLLCVSLFSPVTMASGDHQDHSLDGNQHQGQKPHVHGEADITLVLENNNLLVELISPAFNLAGFEHKPEDPYERAIVNGTAKELKQFTTLLTLPERAGCELQSAEVHSSMLEDDQDGHSHEQEKKSDSTAHADFEVIYQLTCRSPEYLKEIDIQLFEPFPALEKVRVQWVFENLQGAKEATPGKTKVIFQ